MLCVFLSEAANDGFLLSLVAGEYLTQPSTAGTTHLHHAIGTFMNDEIARKVFGHRQSLHEADLQRAPGQNPVISSSSIVVGLRYGSDTGVADEQLRKRLVEIPLAFLEFETGLSRHTIRASPNRRTTALTIVAPS